MGNYIKRSIRNLIRNTVAAFAGSTEEYHEEPRVIVCPGEESNGAPPGYRSEALLLRRSYWVARLTDITPIWGLFTAGHLKDADSGLFLKKSSEQRQKCLKFVALSHQVFLVLIRRIPV